MLAGGDADEAVLRCREQGRAGGDRINSQVGAVGILLLVLKGYVLGFGLRALLAVDFGLDSPR